MEEKNRPASNEDVKNKLLLLLPYIALKESSQKEAVTKMTEELNGNTFDIHEVSGANFNGSDPTYGDTGYSILYYPMNYSELHTSAIFIDVGIGGIH